MNVKTINKKVDKKHGRKKSEKLATTCLKTCLKTTIWKYVTEISLFGKANNSVYLKNMSVWIPISYYVYNKHLCFSFRNKLSVSTIYGVSDCH